jgi:hydrogenase/urease accessory protein HupE
MLGFVVAQYAIAIADYELMAYKLNLANKLSEY